MTDWLYRECQACRICGSTELEPVMSLGPIHISAFPSPSEPDTPAIPIELLLCRGGCNLLQLRHTTNPDLLYKTYHYRSGVNQTMREALADVTRCVEAAQELREGDVVVDIGSNDNTLLKSYQVPGLRRLGFEPSGNIGGEAARDTDVEIMNDYFHFVPALESKASVVTSIAMFYDLDDPHAFVENVRKTLRPDGLWIIQLAYLPSVLDRVGFDGMCHEHLQYYCLEPLEYLLARHDFAICDAQLVDINEGSIRLWVRRRGRGEESSRLKDIREVERRLRLDTLEPYRRFNTAVQEVKETLVSHLQHARQEGRLVHGYGASTKGNTLLQVFGLDTSLISAIWERQPQKWGHVTVRSRIPIISEEAGRASHPDDLLVLPWHFASEFLQREADYLAAGGTMLIPLPRFRIVSQDPRLPSMTGTMD